MSRWRGGWWGFALVAVLLHLPTRISPSCRSSSLPFLFLSPCCCIDLSVTSRPGGEHRRRSAHRPPAGRRPGRPAAERRPGELRPFHAFAPRGVPAPLERQDLVARRTGSNIRAATCGENLGRRSSAEPLKLVYCGIWYRTKRHRRRLPRRTARRLDRQRVPRPVSKPAGSAARSTARKVTPDRARIGRAPGVGAARIAGRRPACSSMIDEVGVISEPFEVVAQARACGAHLGGPTTWLGCYAPRASLLCRSWDAWAGDRRPCPPLVVPRAPTSLTAARGAAPLPLQRADARSLPGGPAQRGAALGSSSGQRGE